MAQPVLYFTEDVKSAIQNALIQSIGNWIQFVVWRDNATFGPRDVSFLVRDMHLFSGALLNEIGKDITGWVFPRITMPPDAEGNCKKCDVVVKELTFWDDVSGNHAIMLYDCVACKKDIPNVRLINKQVADLTSIGSDIHG